MPTRVMLVLLAAAAIVMPSQAPPQALFTVQERQARSAARPNPRCSPEPYEVPITYTQLTVLETREVEYRVTTVAPCLGETGNPPFVLRWEGQGDAVAVTRATLPVAGFEELKAFLDRPDVRAVQDFMNAGPGVGDFKVAIARPAGIQTIEVLSLSPSHYQLIKDPALVRVVCKAKELARRVSPSVAPPPWCDLKPKA